MKKSTQHAIEFLPAVFCMLFLELGNLVLYSLLDDSPSGEPSTVYGIGGPPFGLLLVIALFSEWSEFWLGFSCFQRCLLKALATVGVGSIITGLLLTLDSPDAGVIENVGALILADAETSFFWFPVTFLLSWLVSFCLDRVKQK